MINDKFGFVKPLDGFLTRNVLNRWSKTFSLKPAKGNYKLQTTNFKQIQNSKVQNSKQKLPSNYSNFHEKQTSTYGRLHWFTRIPGSFFFSSALPLFLFSHLLTFSPSYLLFLPLFLFPLTTWWSFVPIFIVVSLNKKSTGSKKIDVFQIKSTCSKLNRCPLNKIDVQQKKSMFFK